VKVPIDYDTTVDGPGTHEEAIKIDSDDPKRPESYIAFTVTVPNK
jgi:hypothetical protein